jgi:hypothetical protein
MYKKEQSVLFWRINILIQRLPSNWTTHRCWQPEKTSLNAAASKRWRYTEFSYSSKRGCYEFFSEVLPTYRLSPSKHNKISNHKYNNTSIYRPTQLITFFNPFSPELFLKILAHPVFKMWIIQEPNKVELWNRRHFEERKPEIMQHV